MAKKKRKNRPSSASAQHPRRGAASGDLPIENPYVGAARSAARGVPSLDAFDAVPRRKPPDLPGYERDRLMYEEQTRPQRPAPPQPAHQSAKQGAPPRQKKPPKPANPARKRRNRRIAGIVAILVLVCAGVCFSLTVLFKIERYSIQGESPYSEEEIIAVFGKQPGDNMFGFTVGASERQLEQSLPYLESVSIRRRLPDTIVFRVEPAVETYYIVQDGQVAVLSATRKLLRLADAEPEGLTRIIGISNVEMVVGLPLSVIDSGTPETPVDSSAQSRSEAASSAPQPEPAAAAEGDTAPAEQAQTEEAALLEGGEEPPAGEEPAPEGEQPSAEQSIPPEETPAPEAQVVQQGPAAALQSLNALLTELEKTQLTDITWIDVTDELDLRICWQDRIVVKLGAGGNLDKKLQFAEVLLTDTEISQITEGDRGTLDISGYPASVDRVWLKPE